MIILNKPWRGYGGSDVDIVSIIRTPQMPIGLQVTKRTIQMSQVKEAKGGDQTREMVVTQIVVMGITEITIHQVGRTKIINSPMG
jgi:hypothetical protein